MSRRNRNIKNTISDSIGLYPYTQINYDLAAEIELIDGGTDVTILLSSGVNYALVQGSRVVEDVGNDGQKTFSSFNHNFKILVYVRFDDNPSAFNIKYSPDIKKLHLYNYGEINTMNNAFRNLINLTDFTCSADTSAVINCYGTFHDSLEAINIGLFDTSNVTSFERFMANCPKLQNIGTYDVSSGLNFRNAWNGNSFTTFPITYFPIGTNFIGAWSNSFEMVHFPAINTPNAADLTTVMTLCPKLQTIGGFTFNPLTLTAAAGMFRLNPELTDIYGTINTTSLAGFYQEFYACPLLVQPSSTDQAALTSPGGDVWIHPESLYTNFTLATQQINTIVADDKGILISDIVKLSGSDVQYFYIVPPATTKGEDKYSSGDKVRVRGTIRATQGHVIPVFPYDLTISIWDFDPQVEQIGVGTLVSGITGDEYEIQFDNTFEITTLGIVDTRIQIVLYPELLINAEAFIEVKDVTITKVE